MTHGLEVYRASGAKQMDGDTATLRFVALEVAPANEETEFTVPQFDDVIGLLRFVQIYERGRRRDAWSPYSFPSITWENGPKRLSITSEARVPVAVGLYHFA